MIAGLLASSGAAAFTLNPVDDLNDILSYEFMRNAFVAGTIIAIVAGVVGYFVVLRGLSFAGHALSHIGYAGATGAVLLGVAPIYGLLTFSIGAAMAMGGLGKRLYGRDVAIGVVMAFSLGLGQLFVGLYKGGGSSNQSISILFGQVFAITPGDIGITVAISTITLGAMAIMYRPLLFASLDEDVAEARGVPVRGLGIAFLGVTGMAVAQSVQVTGVLLIFGLLVAPAAISQRLTARPGRGIVCAIALAVAFTWTALILAYYTPYPMSFYLTTIAFAAYLASRATAGRSRSPSQSAPVLATPGLAS